MLTKNVTPKYLYDAGFENLKDGPTIADIAHYFQEGFYQKAKLEIDESYWYNGPHYSKSGTPYYYGSTYQDIFRDEFLLVLCAKDNKWYRVAKRKKKTETKLVSNYVGD